MGFILSAIGSAVGIGNIWRFPYIVGTSGGGAFLIPYLLSMFTLGLSLILMELAVGRHFRNSVVASLTAIKPSFKWIGLGMVGVAFAILSYYMVILGWILAYLLGIPFAGGFPDFGAFIGSWYPVGAFLLVLALTFVVVRAGVARGIERLNKVGVLVLIAIMLPLLVTGLLLPGADRGVDFYLQPDFSRMSDPILWGTAFGQVFFSLSVGVGILLTYGSYLKGRQSLLSSSVLIISADFLIAFTSGLMVFAIVFAFGLDPAQGTTLIFVAMPSIFLAMPLGIVVGAMFFLLLFIAGLTSAVSIFQVPVAALEDSAGLGRRKASLVIAVLLLVAGLPSALSYSALNLGLLGTPVLDIMDATFGTFGIVASGALFVIVAGWFMRKGVILEEWNAESRIRIPAWVLTVVKVAAPTVIAFTSAMLVVGALWGS
jgi:NSS family neurotransmitter:Na+ symporter